MITSRVVRIILIVLLFTFPKTVVFAQIIQDADSVMRELDQIDLIDFGAKLFNAEEKAKKRHGDPGRVLFSVIPVAPSSKGDGGITVSAINASFYLSHRSNISTVFFYPYTNLNGSYGLILTPNIWADANAWNGVGDLRYIHNSTPEYGIGTSKSDANPFTVEYKQVRAYFTAHAHIINSFYAGAGYNFDRFYNVGQVVPPKEGQSDFEKYPYGTGESTTSSSITANLLRDNRKNQVNPSNGLYVAVVFRMTRKGMGSDYTWSSYYGDVRKYFSFSNRRHKVLALRAMYWGTYGDVPYYNLPTTFGDPNSRAGRGYSSNRFRGKKEAYLEGEYRFDISHHGFLGGTVFATAQSFTEPNDAFEVIRPAAGVGLRLKFNRYSETNICLDFAYGADGLKFYVNLGEFF